MSIVAALNLWESGQLILDFLDEESRQIIPLARVCIHIHVRLILYTDSLTVDYQAFLSFHADLILDEIEERARRAWDEAYVEWSAERYDDFGLPLDFYDSD